MDDLINHEMIFKDIIKDSIYFSNKRCAHYKGIVDKQEPKITLLTCSDSRVPTNCLIQDTLNKAFVIENIGNQVMTAAGSLDYSIIHLKTPLLLILGHTNCGAVTAALNDYSNETDDIKKELKQIEDGLSAVDARYDRNDKDWLNKYAEKNLDYQVMVSVDRYRKLVDAKKLTVVGMMFDFAGSYGSKIMAYVTNINNETGIGMISASPLIKNSDAQVKRLT